VELFNHGGIDRAHRRDLRPHSPSFKGIPLIPGHTELRPANVIPVVSALLFGPAEAWGGAFGNLIGDFFGTLERRVETALTRVHLLDRARDDPFSLTKGQRQRLAVAGVLALSPKVIILDEPTTGLDHREQQDLLDLIRELHAQGHTVIMLTHSMWRPLMPGAWWFCRPSGSF
jgi:ABC-type dipeptide/oligopeptide/nickel transport system ATPase component